MMKKIIAMVLSIIVCFSFSACSKTESTGIVDSIKSNASETLENYEVDIDSFSKNFKEVQGDAAVAISDFYADSKNTETVEDMLSWMSDMKANIPDISDITVPEEFKLEHADVVESYENLITKIQPMVEVLQNDLSNVDTEEIKSRFDGVFQEYSTAYSEFVNNQTALFEAIEENDIHE